MNRFHRPRATIARALSALGALSLVGVSLAVIAAPSAAAATAAISPVGGLTSAAGSGVTKLSVAPHSAGNAFVAVVKVSSSTTTVTALSGGGVTTWTKLEAFKDASHDNELWLGTVTTPGSSTITVTFSATVTSNDIDLNAQELTTGGGTSTSWSKDTAGGQTNPSSTTVAFPSLTPTHTPELYIGYARGGGNLSAGTTPGYTYATTADANVITYNPAVTATTAPTASVSPAVTSTSIGALITATTSTQPTSPTITAVTPTSGPAAGGTPVTITGTNLTAATTVTFGTTPATITNNTATTITATAPPGTNTIDITVTTPQGTTPTTTNDHYTYTSTTTTAAISPVGGITSITGNGPSTLQVNPQGVGDAEVALIHIVGSNATVLSLSGGGASGWTRFQQYLDTPSWSGLPHDTEIWVGTITSTGSSTFTVSYSQSVSAANIDLAAQEFTAGLGTNTHWSRDTGAGQDNLGSSFSVAFPSLHPSAPRELYFGYAWVPATASTGSTSGFTYGVTADSNLIAFDPNVSATVSPVGSQTESNPSASFAVLIAAS
jgi:hypothetical protein